MEPKDNIIEFAEFRRKKAKRELDEDATQDSEEK